MRYLAILLVAGACGGQPALANAPRPDPAVVAGAAAATAAAITIADPNAATRGKPEKRDDKVPNDSKEVDESVPSDVLDRLDRGSGSGSDAGSGSASGAKPAKKPKGPIPKLPSPKDAAEHTQ